MENPFLNRPGRRLRGELHRREVDRGHHLPDGLIMAVVVVVDPVGMEGMVGDIVPAALEDRSKTRKQCVK